MQGVDDPDLVGAARRWWPATDRPASYARGIAGGIAAAAEPKDGDQVYRELGAIITDRHADRTASVELRLRRPVGNQSCRESILCPRGDLNPHAR
jgi:hypothetical protein